MADQKPARFRGLVGVRADASDPNAILGEINKAFEAFKAEHNKELADVKAGMADVVQTEKVDRINADITAMNKEFDRLNGMIAAMKIGGADAPSPEKAEHAKAFNEFFRKGVEAGLRDLEVKAKLTTQVDQDGGYLVPEEQEAGIDRVLGTVSTVRSLARKVSISGSTYTKLIGMGGAGGEWTAEEEARAETDTPTLRQIAINAKELSAKPSTTQTMLDDAAIDVAGWLADEVAITFAEMEGAAFVNGDGVSQPHGLLSYDKVANASYAWGKLGFIISGKSDGFITPTTSASSADALIDVHYALKAGYRGSASWLMSDATMNTVRKFKDVEGSFVWAPPTGSASVATVLGKPVHTDDNMPSVGSGTFPIAFGDFNRAYLIVDRIGIRVLRDPYTAKPYVQFYTTKRVGGGVVNFEAVKLLKIAST